MSRKFLSGIDLASQRVQNVADPTSAQDAATKNYVDTTAAAIQYGGWGDGDSDVYADLLSTFPRNMLINGNFTSLGIVGGVSNLPSQVAYFFKVKRAFTSTGMRYVTGASSGTTGATVTASLYVGTTLGAMTLAATSAAPFTTTSTLVSVPWSGSITVPVGWAAIVFTTTAAGATPPRLMTLAANNTAGATFLNPSTGIQTASFRPSSSALPTTMDFTTGWTLNLLTAWLALY